VLITLVILSTGIVLVLRAFETSLFALGESRIALRGAMLVREKMAEIQQTALRDGKLEPSLSSERLDQAPYKGFRRQCTIRVASDQPTAGENGILYLASVTALRDGSASTVSSSTYVFVPQHPK
jgi:hypothetical protein